MCVPVPMCASHRNCCTPLPLPLALPLPPCAPRLPAEPQMDVAPRQSFVAGIVPPAERTATLGLTNIGKSIGAAFGPLVTGFLVSHHRFDWAFYLCGGLKIVYDLALLYNFRHVKPQH